MSYGHNPPPWTGNIDVWAQNVIVYLRRVASRLAFKGSESRATENGVFLWDNENGYPVVSLDGEWREIVLGNSSLDFGVRLAEAEILSTYGDTVSTVAKSKTLLKFGRNDNLGTALDTVWTQGGNEVYATTNAIDIVSSSNATDTQTITIEGHTVSGTGTSSQFTFVVQTVALNGQNKVSLPTPLARVSRLYAGTSAFAGDIYVYEDTTIVAGVPTTSAPIHMKVEAGDTQSFKSATTFSNTDYAIVTGGFASVDKKTAATVDFVMEVRPPGQVFRPVSKMALDSSAQTSQQIQFYPYVIVPKNSDIRIRAVSSSLGTAVSASFQCFIAEVQ